MEQATNSIPKGVVFVNKSEHLEEFVVEEMKKKLHHFIEIYNHKFPTKPIHEFRITIKEHSKTGSSHQYWMHALLRTDRGDFNAEKEGWNAVVVVDHIIDALRRQVLDTRMA